MYTDAKTEEQQASFRRVLVEVLHEGYSRGVIAVANGAAEPPTNPRLRADTPLSAVWHAAAAMGFSTEVAHRRNLEQQLQLAAPATTAPDSLSELMNTVDELSGRINVQASRISDLEAAVALMAAPAPKRRKAAPQPKR